MVLEDDLHEYQLSQHRTVSPPHSPAQSEPVHVQRAGRYLHERRFLSATFGYA
jgi:hypothetical protein